MNLHQVLGPAKRTLLLAMLDDASGKRSPISAIGTLGALGRMTSTRNLASRGSILPTGPVTGGDHRSHHQKAAASPPKENQPCQKRLIARRKCPGDSNGRRQIGKTGS